MGKANCDRETPPQLTQGETGRVRNDFVITILKRHCTQTISIHTNIHIFYYIHMNFNMSLLVCPSSMPQRSSGEKKKENL